MKKALLSSILFGAVALTTSNTAAAAETAKKNLNPWIDCGIGAMIFKSSDAGAVISNIIWDMGTTAVTSNMSSQNTCNSERAQTAMFIKATLPALEQEVVVGEGEYLTAMLETRGCEASSHKAIINAIRNDLAEAPSEGAEALYNTVEKQVQANFTAACSAV